LECEQRVRGDDELDLVRIGSQEAPDADLGWQIVTALGLVEQDGWLSLRGVALEKMGSKCHAPPPSVLASAPSRKFPCDFGHLGSNDLLGDAIESKHCCLAGRSFEHCVG